MELSRRKLLLSAAPAAALLVAGCTSAQLASAEQQWSNFVDQVNAALAAGCNSVFPAFTATANTIEGIVTALYPSVGVAVSTGIAAVNLVVTKICGALPATPPASLKRRLLSSSAALPVKIATAVVNGVAIPIIGYQR